MEKHSNELLSEKVRLFFIVAAGIILSVMTARLLPCSISMKVLWSLLFILLLGSFYVISLLVMSLPNASVKKQYGFSAIITAVSNGFAFLFPFAILALFADLVFSLNTVQPVTSAAIFTCNSIISSELSHVSGKSSWNNSFSLALSITLIVIYNLAISAAK